MIQKIAAQIRSLIGRRRPETAIILGSGLGALADEITDSVSISYADIDGFPQSTVQGHGGKLIIGRLENKGNSLHGRGASIFTKDTNPG